jgi:hypothetical protein
LRQLAKQLNKPRAQWKQPQIVRKIERWLSAPFLAELIRCQLEEHAGGWHCNSTSIRRLLPSCSINAFGNLIWPHRGRFIWPYLKVHVNPFPS